MKPRRRPAWHRIDGIVLLDKPQGLSSNQALQKVRNLFRAEKAGHAGALDPLATGLLPVCLGEATKIAGRLLSGSKAYHTRVRLGVETDTDDAEGEVLRRHALVQPPSRALIEALVPRFLGRIRQVPPRYSALKRDGEPLYRMARRGEVFEVPAREVEVHRIDVLDAGQDWFDLEIECGSGTYIRSLARDFGEALGCGGHVEQLRRLWVDPFRNPVLHTLGQLEALAGQGDAALAAVLLPIAAGLPDWRRVVLDVGQAVDLRHGRAVALARELPGEVLALAADGVALGLAEIDDNGLLHARRMFLPMPA